MKFKTSIILFFAMSISAYSQYSMVINEELMLQVTTNNAVRLSSAAAFTNVFKEQKEIYEKNEKELLKILAIHEHIYKQLYNVNSLFKQSRQVRYIAKYFGYVVKNGEKMVNLGLKYPEYSVWLTKRYQELFQQAIQLKSKLEQVLLKPNKEILMDAYDRDELIENVLFSLRRIIQ